MPASVASNRHRLIVVLGPTAVGKTAYAITLAQQLSTEIISFDSRQFYAELNIGVARPSEEELAAARHHFIACRSVQDPYNIFQYAEDALALLDRLFLIHDTVVAVGGSGLYAEALCNGVAVLPDPPAELRSRLSEQLAREGVEPLQQMLKALDPEYYAKVDLNNGIRLQRALEVCLTAGKPYSQMLRDSRCQRPFEIEYHIVEAAPEVMRTRIDTRVDMMMRQGLVDEASSVQQYRHLNTLNTVGYKELFQVIDGLLSLPEAVQQIKWHTWQYAKKQLTWLKRLRKTTPPEQIHSIL